MIELHGGLHPASRAGVVGFTLLFGAAVICVAAFALGAFLFSGNSEENKLGGIVSGTLGDVFGVRERKNPVLELDLGARVNENTNKEREQGSEDGENKAAAETVFGAAKIAATNVSGNQSSAAEVKEEEEVEVPLPRCDFTAVSGSPAEKRVIFNEIAWMGTPRGANDEWLELKNISAGAVNLYGWQILSGDGRIKFRFGDAVLGAGEFFLLERTDDDSLPEIKADAIYSGLLPNEGSWLRLIDSDCALVDEINAAGGWTRWGGDRVSRRTLERSAAGGWQTSSEIGGTPRRENSSGDLVVNGSSNFSPPAAPAVPQISPPPAAPPSSSGKININTAGYEELQRITGVGPVIAGRIIEYRQVNGPFRSLEEIKKVNGIGDKTFEKMKEEITL